MTLTLEAARAVDLDAVRTLLSSNGLPVDDLDPHLTDFLLARQEGTTIGTVALEHAGEAALLRSLCVAQSQRGRSVGARLLEAIEAIATARGVRELYLLTTAAAGFFSRHGYATAPRESAPDGIRRTAQFLTLCPSTAVCLRKALPSHQSPTKAAR